MAEATIDGIRTHYEVLGDGPPILMYAPGGFDATIEKWRTQGVYQRVKFLEHLPKRHRCIAFDRRECGQSGGRVEDIGWAHYVRQGKGLLEHLGIERAHIMGGCMGSRARSPSPSRIPRRRYRLSSGGRSAARSTASRRTSASPITSTTSARMA